MRKGLFFTIYNFFSSWFDRINETAGFFHARMLLRRLRKLLPSLYPFGRTIFLFIRRFDERDGFLSASSISFSAITSAFPLMLLLLAIWGDVLTKKSEMLSVELAIRGMDSFMPGLQSELALAVHTLAESSTLLGGIGIVGLIWFGGSLFYGIEAGINRLFGSHTARGFWHRTLISFILMALGYILLISALLSTVIVTLISDIKIEMFGITNIGAPILLKLFFELGPFLFVFLFLYLVYRLIPAIKVRKRAALYSAFFSAIFWELARRGFSVYLSNFASYNKLYGALGALAALFAWVYYSSVIFLMGGQLTAIINERLNQRSRIRNLKRAASAPV